MESPRYYFILLSKSSERTFLQNFYFSRSLGTIIIAVKLVGSFDFITWSLLAVD